MKKILFFLIAFALVAALICSIPLVAKAHPGGTDSKGGHTSSATGDYHYHHGYSAHQHYDIDGDGIADCPYDFKDNTDHVYRTTGITDHGTKEDEPSFWIKFISIFKAIGYSVLFGFSLTIVLLQVTNALWGIDFSFIIIIIAFLGISFILFIFAFFPIT